MIGSGSPIFVVLRGMVSGVLLWVAELMLVEDLVKKFQILKRPIPMLNRQKVNFETSQLKDLLNFSRNLESFVVVVLESGFLKIVRSLQ